MSTSAYNPARKSPSRTASALVDTVYLSARSVVVTTTRSIQLPSPTPRSPSLSTASVSRLVLAQPARSTRLHTRTLLCLRFPSTLPPILTYHLILTCSRYGVLIEQNYDGGDLHGDADTGVPITGLTLDNVTGDVSSSGYDVVVTCGKGSCTGWTWTGVDVTGGKTYDKCSNVPSVTKCS